MRAGHIALQPPYINAALKLSIRLCIFFISSDRLQVQAKDPIGMGGKQGGSIPWGGF